MVAITGFGSSAGHAQGLIYDMELALDPGTHRVHGIERIRFTNRSSHATGEVQLHLYLNAFSSSQSTFMRELERSSLRGVGRYETSWGWTRIDRIVTADGDDITARLEFIRPDDGNERDFSVARVLLPTVLEPAASVELTIEFESQLPRIIARTGYAGEFHMVGQFFPKLGVLTEDGWNCHQFHAASEFFSDFADYRVAVSVPTGWVVGATGHQVDRRETGATDRIVFRADRVHDFAWCAAPVDLMTVVEADFDPAKDVPAVWLERAATHLDLAVSELQLPPLQIRLVVPRQQRDLADRMIRAARLGIAWMGLWYGPYPYPQLTVVAPPPTAEESWGMEYPTLITTGASRLLGLPGLRRIPWIEMITVHEFGHQYFYGLLASNEFEEAWLDEGLTSFAEISFLQALREDAVAPGIRVPDVWALERLQLGAARVPVRPDRLAWEHRTLGDYGLASYTKTALAIKTLEGLLGSETLAQALREYVTRYRFDHPTGTDFEATVAEVTGDDLAWFFDQTVRGDAVADWGVVEVRQSARRAAEGLALTEGGWTTLDEPPPADDRPWLVEIDLVRLGDLVGPVEVELVFADGRRDRRTWSSDARWETWRLDSPEMLHRVTVDPDGVWALETRRADNYWVGNEAPETAEKRLWWLPRIVDMLRLLPMPWS